MDKNTYTLEALGINHRFAGPFLFRNLNLQIKTGQSVSICGANGSGKSTLLKILSTLLTPISGKVELSAPDRGTLSSGDSVFQACCAYLSPELNLYGNLSGLENLSFVSGSAEDYLRSMELLRKFGLENEGAKLYKNYSSGMKQRLKIISALCSGRPLIFLDEPSANLDNKGKEILFSCIENIRHEKILVIATNEETEKKLCRTELNLD